MEFGGNLKVEEHELIVRKIISVFEGSSAEVPQKINQEQLFNFRMISQHWSKSIRQCAEKDLQEKEFEMVQMAVEHGDALDSQIMSVLKGFPVWFAMTMLPDVKEMAGAMDDDVEVTTESLLEAAEKHEWDAKLAAFQARLKCDQRLVQEIATGHTLLKDALDWLASSKRLEEAKKAKTLVDSHVERCVPTLVIDDMIDLPGELAKSVPPMENNAKNQRLIVLHVDFNVPGATRPIDA